ncbi:hypothetical protein [Clostridium sp.]|nr:hypothetical protein [Clostridium sp.]MDO5038321.1 hypothetical protein [Clostridium sp.]
MPKQPKSAVNNQWISTPVEVNGVPASKREPKTEGNNQWTSTNKNPMK